VHVTDVAAANLGALLADPPESALRAYNVASGTPHTVGDMARALADAFGGPNPEVTGEYRIGDVRHVVASPVRAEKELGFRARVQFEDGMRAFATDPLRAAP
jgi:dTDP-L-rhamnose 4-epimerase